MPDMPLSGWEYHVRDLTEMISVLVGCMNVLDSPSHSAHGALNVQRSGDVQGIRIDFTNCSQGRIDLLDAFNVRLIGFIQSWIWRDR